MCNIKLSQSLFSWMPSYHCLNYNTFYIYSQDYTAFGGSLHEDRVVRNSSNISKSFKYWAEFLKPGPWRLFQSIDWFVQLADFTTLPSATKLGGCYMQTSYCKSMYESIFYIELMELPIHISYKRYIYSIRVKLCHGENVLLKSTPCVLIISLNYKPCLKPLYCPISVKFNFINPLITNCFLSFFLTNQSRSGSYSVPELQSFHS